MRDQTYATEAIAVDRTALQRLSEAQEAIYKATDSLEEKLSPFLGSGNPQTSGQPESPAGTALHNISTTAEMQAQRIWNLIDRLEV